MIADLRIAILDGRFKNPMKSQTTKASQEVIENTNPSRTRNLLNRIEF
jgi:hypothetical protein